MTKQEEGCSLEEFFFRSAKWRDDIRDGVQGWEGDVLSPVMGVLWGCWGVTKS